MVLAILHTREFRDYTRFARVLDGLRQKLPALTKIVTAGAPGADPLGAQYARAHSLPLQVLRPNYQRFGREARWVVNGLVLQKAGALVAFWDGRSAGTRHALELARRQRLPYVIEVSVTGSYAVANPTIRP